jgi:hypothetical protein
MGDDYVSYYIAMDEERREIALAGHHGHRQAVDSVIHTGYEKKILNAAMTPASAPGLTNYGPITIHLRQVSIEDRSTVLRENAFEFFERYRLGDQGAAEEPGWRSVWTQRQILGVAHVTPLITVATPANGLADLVMLPGAGRHDDRFMEVHIFGTLDWQSIEAAVLELPLTSTEDRDDWDFARTKLIVRGVSCDERQAP